MMKILLWLHVAGGSAALLSMLTPLVSRKGGRTHRRAGWVFVTGMTVLSITALLMALSRYVMQPFPGARTSAIFLGYLAVLTGAGVSTGVRVLRAKARTAAHHNHWDVGVSTLLVAAAILVAAYGIAIGQALLVAFAVVGFLSGSGQLAYWLRSPSHPMHWWFEHMGQMLGSCLAAVTAFVVNNGFRVGLSNSSVLVWLAPTIVGLPIITIWIRYYVRRFTPQSSQPSAASESQVRSSATAAAIVVLLLPGLAPALHAQDGPPPASQKRFEVASVRPNRADTRQNAVEASATGLRLTNWALRPIIQLAFGVDQPSKLSGVPPWAETERFDILARGAIASRDDMRAMLRTLLAERFRLSAHSERRQVPVYRLVVARPGDGPGQALHPSSAECAATPGAPGSAQTPANAVRCGPQPGGPGRLVLVGSPVGILAGILSLMVGRPVVDDTGVAGRFDIDVTYASDAERAAGADGPSIFTALQEQLGLKLNPGQQEQEVLVIDRVERPDAD